MKRKLMATLLSMAMIISMLTGCSSDKKDDAGKANAGSEKATEASKKDTAEDKTSEDVILIGGVNDLSGNRSVTGNAINRGVELAVKEINEAGGILGRKVEYKVYDNQNDAQETINAYTRLCDVDKVSAVITSDASTICMSLIEVSSNKKIPVMGMPSDPRATMNKDTGEVYPYMFLVSQPNAPSQANLIANYVNENVGLKKGAIFYDQSNAYAVASVEAFEEIWKGLGNEIVVTQTCNSTDQDYKTQLNKIKASGADFIFCPIATTQLVLLANQASQLGMKLPYVGAMDMADPFLSLINTPEDVTAYFEAVADMSSDRVANLNAAYKEAYGEAAQVKSVNGYDAMYILKAAIEAAGSSDPEAIRNALENDIKDLKLLVSDNYTADPATHAPKNLGMVICKIKDGELTTEGWYEVK